MNFTDFRTHREDEIRNRPFDNLASLEIGEDEYYYSPLGSNEYGTYEWNSLDDPSFKVCSVEQLITNDEFMNKVMDSAIANGIDLKDKHVKVLIREILDATVGCNLPFTLLDAAAFNKELLYYNTKG